VSVKEFTQGPVTDQPVTFRIIGDVLADIRGVAIDLEQEMRKKEGLVNIRNSIGRPNTELALDIHYDKAALSGVDVYTLDSTVKTLLSGESVGKFSDIKGESYPIVVKGKSPELSRLSSIYVTNNQGQQIPLASLVDFNLQKGDADFFHYQKLRMAKVSADVSGDNSIKALTDSLTNFLENYDLPNGVYFDVGGEEENRAKSFSGLTQIMIISIVGIMAVLVLQFKSFVQPLIIFSSIPFAMLGSVLGLYLFNVSFSLMAFIGLISLFGIVVNNAIILVDCTNSFIKQGQEKYEAVVNASATRFTPIILTTLTTIGGLLPLTILGGNLWMPLGLVIISGLCFSTISSLLVVPILTAVLTKTPKTAV
jgi:multidrug efflux pump subunit AcrB